MSADQKQVGGDHYQTEIQHHEFVRKNNIPWHEGCTIKYIVRHKKKNGVQDLLKAIHYILLMLPLEYEEADVRKFYRKLRALLPDEEE